MGKKTKNKDRDLNPPGPEIIREHKTSDEDFANVLLNQRKNREESEALESLALRLGGLQKKLEQLKEQIKREKIFYDLKMLKEISSDVRMNRESLKTHYKDNGVEAISYDEEATNILQRVNKVYMTILEREFPLEKSGSE